MKKISNIFWVFAALLSHIMCAAVAYSYCDMQWGIRYACYSAPASVAFLLAIPFLIGICVCVLAALWLRAKGK